MIRTLGLALVAALAVSAVAVATSSAALPEFKATKFPVTFTSKNKAGVEPVLKSLVLNNTVEENIKCKTSADKGEIGTATSVKKISVEYTECREAKAEINKCTSTGQAQGVIKTALVQGRIGYTLPLEGKKVGVELEPEAGAVFAEFNCTGVAGAVKVEGCTIGEATPTNVKSNKGTLTFAENAGKTAQLYTAIEGGVHKPCELNVHAGFFELGEGKSWLSDVEEEAFVEEIELKA
jgi:hypothetical protein